MEIFDPEDSKHIENHNLLEDPVLDKELIKYIMRYYEVSIILYLF